MENLNYRNCNEEVTVKLIGKVNNGISRVRG